MFQECGTRLFISHISIWEMKIKFQTRHHKSGNRKSPHSPAEVLAVANHLGFEFLPLDLIHLTTRLQVPLRHRDPFDEILLVQAQCESLRFLTIDRLLIEHPLALSF